MASVLELPLPSMGCRFFSERTRKRARNGGPESEVNAVRRASTQDHTLDTNSRRTIGQTIWGAALLLAGIGVFIRVPQVMPEIAKIEQFSSVTGIIRFCFYFIGVMLIGGGGKKLYASYKRSSSDDEKEEPPP